jgi:hypothetical protein
MRASSIARGERGADRLLEPGEGDVLRPRERLVRRQVLLAGPADADDADADVAHRASNHPRGDSGLPGTARRTPGAGAAHMTAFAITRWMSAWW